MLSIRHSHSESARFLIGYCQQDINFHEFNGISRLPSNVHAIVNYGKFTGDNEYLNRSPVPVINKTWAGDKLECLHKVNRAGIVTPVHSEPGNNRSFNSSWIIKPRHSARGQNIRTFCASERIDPHTEYLQRIVEHRCYELRVQCCAWIPIDDWMVIKRTNRNPSELVWNRDPDQELNKHIDRDESNTGVFRRAKEMAQKAMQALGYQFGAVDFIVARPPNHSGPLPIYFLEFNTEPCCVDTEKTRQYYLHIFRTLNTMTKEQIATICGQTVAQEQARQAPVDQPRQTPVQTQGGIRSQLEQILRTVKSINDAQVGQIGTLVNQSATNLQRVIEMF